MMMEGESQRAPSSPVSLRIFVFITVAAVVWPIIIIIIIIDDDFLFEIWRPLWWKAYVDVVAQPL